MYIEKRYFSYKNTDHFPFRLRYSCMVQLCISVYEFGVSNLLIQI